MRCVIYRAMAQRLKGLLSKRRFTRVSARIISRRDALTTSACDYPIDCFVKTVASALVLQSDTDRADVL